MQQINYDNNIVEIEKTLRCLCAKIKYKGREILVSFSITPSQFEALQYLKNSTGITIGELSDKMFLACSTVTDLVDRMEESGLVKRVRDNKDRRVVRVYILEKGHKLINKVLHARRNYLAYILKDICKEDRKLILEGIYKIYNNAIKETNIK